MKSAGLHDDTTLLLGLDGVVVDRVELDPDGCRVVHLVTAAEVEPVCPSCQTPSSAPRGWVLTRPRDVAGPVRSRLVWRKRRWRCRTSSCGRGSFTESAPQLPPRARVTARLKTAAGRAVAVGGRTITQAGRDHGLSWPTVSAAFVREASVLLPAEPVCALGGGARTRPAAVDPATTATRRPAPPRWPPTGGTPGSSTWKAGMGCSGRSKAAPPPTPGPGSPPATPPGGPERRWWPSTCAPPTGPPCAPTCPRPPSSWTTSTSCNWPTAPSTSYAAASPQACAAAASAPATPSTASGDGCCATARTSPTPSSPTCGTG